MSEAIRRAKYVPLPADGVWRVNSWPEPFAPKDPPPPIGAAAAREDDAGRWDAPDGTFRVLYCATQAEGAIGEKLAALVQSPEAVTQIEAYLVDEPDPEYADDVLAAPLTADDIAGLNLACARVHTDARAIDVMDAPTILAFGPQILAAVGRFGHRILDRLVVLTERRNITRTLGGVFYRAACDGHDEPVWAAGLRYESRHLAAWECWALWEPLPLDREYDSQPLTIDDVRLRSAAAKLGLQLADSHH